MGAPGMGKRVGGRHWNGCLDEVPNTRSEYVATMRTQEDESLSCPIPLGTRLLCGIPEKDWEGGGGRMLPLPEHGQRRTPFKLQEMGEREREDVQNRIGGHIGNGNVIAEMCETMEKWEEISTFLTTVMKGKVGRGARGGGENPSSDPIKGYEGLPRDNV